VVAQVRGALLRAPRRSLAGFGVALVVAAVVAAPVVNELQPFSSDDPGSQSVAARRAIERATGIDPYFGLVALVPTPSGAASPAGLALQSRVQRLLAADPAVAQVSGYPSTRDPSMVARDGRSAYVVASLRARPVNAELDAARRAERRLAPLTGVKLGGLAAFYAQGNDLARHDLILAELFAFPLLLLVALWVFRGLVAAVLPLLLGAVTIVGTLAVLRLLSGVTDVSIYALNIATALGLGLAVDYSLLIVSRYREEMAVHGPGEAALRRTLATAGRTVLISSLTVAGVLSCLTVFPQAFLRSIGFGGVAVSLIAGACALTLLPVLLAMLRWRVNALSFARWRRAAHDRAQPSAASGWYRHSRRVTRRPLPFAIAGAAVLLALASPALNLQITQVDANVMPVGSGARAVHDAIRRDFPARDEPSITLAVSAPAGASSEAALRAYAARLRSVAGVAAVIGPTRLSPGLARLDVIGSAAPLSGPAQQLVARIRSLPGPFPALAGGETPSLVDLKASISRRLPLALLILLLVTSVAVFAMTRSVTLIATAIAMSALTIAAVLGTMVLVFQNGALEGLLGYTSSHALEPSTLVLIFAMAFGLATDYGIFLLSRIREVRDEGAGDAEAVAVGLERTGPVVTAAALLLCIALGSLMTASHALVKEVGFGAALAVALDATVVRAMLLPAVMILLGRAAWWAPAGLRPRRPPRPAVRAGAYDEPWPSRAPARPEPADLAETLAASPFCDHQEPSIRAALEALRERAPDGDIALAVAVFEFVRDEIVYAFGPWGVPASRTLGDRAGTCTNKANLLVALLRAAGVPAAYGVLRVNAREYFGVLGPRFLSRQVSSESVHVYAAAHLDGRWVKCDPSTDRELSERTAHFSAQTRLIDWDGRVDSMDFLDPRHVYADLGLYANIDELLARPPRAGTDQVFTEANRYLRFIRSEPPFQTAEALIDAYRASAGSGGREGPRIPVGVRSPRQR
jgi:RND superfamily putative drug exporter